MLGGWDAAEAVRRAIAVASTRHPPRMCRPFILSQEVWATVTRPMPKNDGVTERPKRLHRLLGACRRDCRCSRARRCGPCARTEAQSRTDPRQLCAAVLDPAAAGAWHASRWPPTPPAVESPELGSLGPLARARAACRRARAARRHAPAAPWSRGHSDGRAPREVPGPCGAPSPTAAPWRMLS